MQVDGPERIRNLALTGHSDTGKTTLANALLYAGGAVNRMARVDDGNTVTDFDPEEIERRISIGMAACYTPWRGHKVNLLDCPGYGIFFAETRGAMRAADAAVLCVNAVAGIEVVTERVWEFAGQVGVPLVVHLTMMDRERADFDRVVAALAEGFDRAMVPVQLPLGREAEFAGVVDLIAEKAWEFERDGNGQGKAREIPEDLSERAAAARTRLVELVAENDDTLMERYFEAGTLTADELRAGLAKAVAARRVFPITCGCPAHNIGVAPLLDLIVDALPSPVARPVFAAHTIGGEPAEVAAEGDGAAAALVFKTLNDPFSGKLSLMRVVRGTLTSDSSAWNVRAEEQEKLGTLLHVQGKHGEGTPRLVTGDIGAVAKLHHTRTGDSLTDKGAPVHLGWIEIRPPAMAFAVEPKSKGDEEKIGDALERLMDEDPTLHVGRDPETGEFLISGTGQLHVEIAVARLKKRYKVEVILHPPRVPYRETIRRAAEGHGRHKKQTGGRGQFADCKVKLEPLARGEGFDFVDEIYGGAIPQGYRPAVRKGIEEACRKGYLAGNPVVDLRVRLLDGQYHEVDSSEMAFKIAGSLAFKDAMARAAAVLLEPMMAVEIVTTEDHTGDVISDLSQRRGRPQGMETRDGQQIVKATVPLAEMLDYEPTLRSMTQGRARFQMELSHYEEVPKQVQDKLIAEAEGRKAAQA
ncbi:MAG: elongation factor G [Thermoanaerobaculia bacterium]